MKDEDQSKLIDASFTVFINYLNMWWNYWDGSQDPPERDIYTKEKFTVWDPSRNLYGETDWEFLSESTNWLSHGVLQILTNDGDEGGGSELFVIFRQTLDSGVQEVPEISYEIVAITHIFDTMPVYIYSVDEGYRVPPDGKMLHDRSYTQPQINNEWLTARGL